MRKRLTFQCWNCPRTYTLFLEFSPEQILVVACPYCNAPGAVDLPPVNKKKRTVSVYKRTKGDEQESGFEFELPEILQTHEINQTH